MEKYAIRREARSKLSISDTGKVGKLIPGFDPLEMLRLVKRPQSVGVKATAVYRSTDCTVRGALLERLIVTVAFAVLFRNTTLESASGCVGYTDLRIGLPPV
jgi:hypothetical protein